MRKKGCRSYLTLYLRHKLQQFARICNKRNNKQPGTLCGIESKTSIKLPAYGAPWETDGSGMCANRYLAEETTTPNSRILPAAPSKLSSRVLILFFLSVSESRVSLGRILTAHALAKAGFGDRLLLPTTALSCVTFEAFLVTCRDELRKNCLRTSRLKTHSAGKRTPRTFPSSTFNFLRSTKVLHVLKDTWRCPGPRVAGAGFAWVSSDL